MAHRIAVLISSLFAGCGVIFAQGLLNDLGPDLPVSDPVCIRFTQLADRKGAGSSGTAGVLSASVWSANGTAARATP